MSNIRDIDIFKNIFCVVAICELSMIPEMRNAIFFVEFSATESISLDSYC